MFSNFNLALTVSLFLYLGPALHHIFLFIHAEHVVHSAWILF